MKNKAKVIGGIIAVIIVLGMVGLGAAMCSANIQAFDKTQKGITQFATNLDHADWTRASVVETEGDNLVAKLKFGGNGCLVTATAPIDNPDQVTLTLGAPGTERRINLQPYVQMLAAASDYGLAQCVGNNK